MSCDENWGGGGGGGGGKNVIIRMEYNNNDGLAPYLKFREENS